MLQFIAGPWGALISKVMLAGTIALGIYIAITQYNHHIAEGQMLKDQNAQMEQVIKDNNEMKSRLIQLERVNGEILIRLEAANTKVIERHDSVTKYIQSPEAQKSNRPTSDVIKNTVRMLKDD